MANTGYPLGSLIVGRLEAMSMKPVDAAKAVGVSRQRFSQWTTGNSRPRDVETLERLRKLLGVSYEDWYTEAIKPKGALTSATQT